MPHPSSTLLAIRLNLAALSAFEYLDSGIVLLYFCGLFEVFMCSNALLVGYNFGGC